MPNRADPRGPLDAEIRVLFDALRHARGLEELDVAFGLAELLRERAAVIGQGIDPPEERGGLLPPGLEPVRDGGGEVAPGQVPPEGRTASNCCRGSRPGGAPPTTSAPS